MGNVNLWSFGFLILGFMTSQLSLANAQDASRGPNMQRPVAPVGVPFIRAPKKIIAVANFENKSSYEGEINLGYGMADMLTDALMKSGQFIVVERQALDAVLAEQNLAESGRAAEGTAAQLGDIKRAQILVEGAVTEFSEATEGGDQGLNIGGFSLASSRNDAHVAIVIRLIDTTTSQVIVSERVEGVAASGGVSYSYSGDNFGFNQSGFKATPLGKATQIAIDRAVAFISSQMAPIPWNGKIIKVSNDLAYLNAGSESNVVPGSIFMVFRKGEELKDPDSGMGLGSEETFVGRLQVLDVYPKFAKAEALDQPVAEGDIVKLPTT